MDRGRICALAVFTEKGKPGEIREKVRFLEGKGIEGDRFADGGPRQISLLAADTRQWMDAQEEKGLCFARYKENIRVKGLDFLDLAEGSVLAVGTAKLRISARGKRCFPECHLLQQGKKCRLSGGICYASVLIGGEAALGDIVTQLSESFK